jgi:(1->4)-alpha-D-glucan 1-alpha-D-glucosylmutase
MSGGDPGPFGAAALRAGAPQPEVPGIPRATVRLQLHRDFTFDDARAQVPYFAALGISHLYVSPILTARAGSTHGYDVTDPGSVNPELGGESALHELVAALRAHGMGLIVDIVPNHMAVGNADNRWWLDVLEWGRSSIYANFFDIDWDVQDPAIAGRVVAPFLGQPYGNALAAQEISLRFDEVAGRFFAAYYEHRFPIAAEHYAALLRVGGEAMAEIARRFRGARRRQGSRPLRRAAFEAACRELALAVDSAPVAAGIAAVLAQFSAATSEGRQRLNRLLERQHYRLAWWRTAADEINWRRFFDITGLAALRIQETAVFNAVHGTILRLYAQGLIDGLRVDHIDGLADPRDYCRRLRARLRALTHRRPAPAPRGAPYLVVEKILAPRELLALDWRVDGTSGYAFMNEVGALLHDPAGEAELRALWSERSGRTGDFAEEERRARRRIAQDLFEADFNACAHSLHVIARAGAETRDWTLSAIRRVLTELLVQFPVYRIYADARGRSPADAEIMQRVVAAAAAACRPGERPLVALIDRWLGAEPPLLAAHIGARRARLRALARFQQLTSPIAAKAVEDTAFYRHGTLLSRNEVGADPAQFAIRPKEFHHACMRRRRRYPNAMLATATHDHKRGEDTRARLAVLSERPALWSAVVQRWCARHAAAKPVVEGVAGPDATDEYLLYQTAVGAWPLDLRADDADGVDALRQRLGEWQLKAVREAKRRSGWVDSNLPYETACREFLDRLFDPARSPDFLAELAALVDDIALPGAVNSLAQTLLRVVTPGIPDLYQGCEWWDLSLVDPDNRRSVDFAARARQLGTTLSNRELLQHWRDARIKQRLIHRALELRAQFPDLFARGRYLPLRVRGPLHEHVLAFLRLDGRTSVLAAVTRLPGALIGPQGVPLVPPQHWASTDILLPPKIAQRAWFDALAPGRIDRDDGTLPVARLFAELPVALLTDQTLQVAIGAASGA